MKYKGIELNPITTPQIFDPPKEMLVWDSASQEPRIELVWCIAPASAKFDYPIRCIGNVHYGFCAEIPEEPKPKRATNLQLMEWLAKGNGAYRIKEYGIIRTCMSICDTLQDTELEPEFQIRPFGTTEWLAPTLENMGIE